ncbi:MAG: hypothetical protein LBB94_04275 [Clostridiales bacterium]|jgi:hypothetical protein|nr:hypothetical protein [Clostridiales bacterium]
MLTAPEDLDIARYIDENPDGRFESVLTRDTRRRVFFHLSPIRESLLNWYPFVKGADILELNAGFGALTGLLCTHGRVTAVQPDTFRARAIKMRAPGAKVVETAMPRQRFDYIIDMDPADFSEAAFKNKANMLNPNGRLLMAFQNPLGVNYWLGGRGFHSGKRYDAAAFSRAETAAPGFRVLKWYYPLPDHWFAREIYSQNFLPNQALNSRGRFHSMNRPFVSADVSVIYGNIIRAGLFEQLTGSFLLEAGLSGVCDVDFAALTTYRKPAGRFATTVHRGGFAKKTALSPEGAANIKRIKQNHDDLVKHGVNTLALSFNCEALIMPRINRETLADYWKRLRLEGRLDENEFIRIFDRVREAILKSSGYDPPGSSGWSETLGAVQHRAYPELVPANCFYSPDTGELLFFDQEFAYERYPVNFVIGRAILSIRYYGLPQELLQTLIKRYNLTECWEQIEAETLRIYNEIFNPAENAIFESAYAEKPYVTYADSDAGDAAFRLTELGVKRAAVYGYGKRGRILYKALDDAGIETLTVDRNGTADYISVSDIKENIELILVSILDNAEGIVSELRLQTPYPVYALTEFLAPASDVYGASSKINDHTGEPAWIRTSAIRKPVWKV